MPVTDLFGIGSAALLVTHFLLLPLLPGRRSRRFNRVALPAAMALALVPVGMTSAAVYTWSALSFLSLPTLALLLHRSIRLTTGYRIFADAERAGLLGTAAPVALLFFPLAGGIGPFDPWSLGFEPALLLCAMALASVAAWRRGMDGLVWLLLAALLAWQLRLLNSTNLWDYLLDPLLGFAALGWCLWCGVLVPLAARVPWPRKIAGARP